MGSGGIPDLEARFLKPSGWQTGELDTQGMRVHYGYALPEGGKPEAIIVCLPGLSEFSEKYYECAQDCLSRNFAFWVIDWPGQGRSQRYLSNPHKRHAQDYSIEVERLHDLITTTIKPDAPLVMLGHSMGGNIGLRFLAQYPNIFRCAAFSAPMFGIQALNRIPFAGLLLKMLNTFKHESYVTGGGDWHEKMRKNNGFAIFSHDETRKHVHDAWVDADPALAVGSPTFGWLYHSYKSCRFLHQKSVLDTIQTPCYISIAGKETIVDNYDTSHVVAKLANSQIQEFNTSGHEILMETNAIRDQFFKSFFALIDNSLSKP